MRKEIKLKIERRNRGTVSDCVIIITDQSIEYIENHPDETIHNIYRGTIVKGMTQRLNRMNPDEWNEEQFTECSPIKGITWCLDVDDDGTVRTLNGTDRYPENWPRFMDWVYMLRGERPETDKVEDHYPFVL